MVTSRPMIVAGLSPVGTALRAARDTTASGCALPEMLALRPRTVALAAPRCCSHLPGRVDDRPIQDH